MKITVDQLVANGFSPKVYDQQEGTFYLKILKAAAMPNFNANVVDGDSVFDTDDIAVEVCPDGRVQLVDQNTDYYQEGVPVDSPEGRALLEDAGFKFS